MRAWDTRGSHLADVTHIHSVRGRRWLLELHWAYGAKYVTGIALESLGVSCTPHGALRSGAGMVHRTAHDRMNFATIVVVSPHKSRRKIPARSDTLE